MPTDDVSSIPGRSFADADRRKIYKAMENIRPRPSLERISRWQEKARSRLEEAETDAPDWHTVASFAVVFAQRQAGDAWERRVEVERTEVEPAQDPQVWADWNFESVGSWMADQLGATDTASTTAQPVTTQPEAAKPVASKAPGRSQLRIDTAAIIDANRTVDVVTRGALVADLPFELIAPVRVVLTVSSARPGTVLHAVTRILRPDGPGWNPQDPVVIRRSDQAEFDLSRLPAGQYEMSLIAWAPDATAKPVSVRLPALTIRSGSD